MFNFLKKIFGSDIPDTPVIAQPKVDDVVVAPPEEPQTNQAVIFDNDNVSAKMQSNTPAKKATAKKPAAKPTTAKKAPAKKPAVAKTDDAPKRRGRPPKSSS